MSAADRVVTKRRGWVSMSLCSEVESPQLLGRSMKFSPPVLGVLVVYATKADAEASSSAKVLPVEWGVAALDGVGE